MSDLDERDAIGPDDAPDADEAIAAERLREALERSPDDARAAMNTGVPEDVLDLVSALRSAWSPEAASETWLAEAADDAAVSADEAAAAAELAEALEKQDRPDVVVALEAAFRPSPIGADEHAAIVARVLASAPREGRVVPLVRRVAIATTTFAVAAGFVLWILSPAAPVEAPLARVRSTEALFDTPFSGSGASARIDRIATAREADFRDNRFATWGVR